MVFSIIVPVYNVEKYLKRCIFSVINNGYPDNQYEIVVVDDESPDESVSIIKSLQNPYNQIKLFRQKNKGLGGARNTGVKNAKGQYIIFLDADDLLVNGVLTKLEKFLSRQKEPEIIELGAQRINEKMELLETFAPVSNQGMQSGVTYYNNSNSINSACNKLYNREFVKKHSLTFREKLYSEDLEFNTRALFLAQKVISTDIILEQFVQTTNSITRNDNIKVKKRLVNDFLKIVDYIVDFRDNLGSLNEEEIKFFNNRLTKLVTDVFYQSLKYGFDNNYIRQIRNQLKQEGKYYLYHKTRGVKDIIRVIVKEYFYLYCLINWTNKRLKILK